MPEYNSRQIFKWKALERWENEGGNICADQIGIIKSGLLDNGGGKDYAAQTSGSPKVDRYKGREIK